MTKIALHEPKIGGNEWKYIKECLDTDWVSSGGKYVDFFEEKIAEYTEARYAVACVNGTSALQVALRMAGVLPGDEVIAPTLTFIASVNAITYNGATPVFMDADKYYNVDPEKTVSFIENETIFKDGYSYNKKTNKKISAIVPVHVWGNACRLDELVAICHERNIVIVEDASESLGTSYIKGKFAGKHTGTIGKLGCISFNGNKIITTGGGGMILTNDSSLAEKARYLSTQAKDDALRYIHDEIGYNFRLTNIQAALGVAQLEQLPEFIKKKKVIHAQYTEEFNKPDVNLAPSPAYADCNFWLNSAQVQGNMGMDEVERLMGKLTLANIQARPIWALNHLQKPYLKNQSHEIKHAIKLWNTTISLPSSVSLEKDDISRVVSVIYG